jgi:hypothetical protein
VQALTRRRALRSGGQLPRKPGAPRSARDEAACNLRQVFAIAHTTRIEWLGAWSGDAMNQGTPGKPAYHAMRRFKRSLDSRTGSRIMQRPNTAATPTSSHRPARQSRSEMKVPRRVLIFFRFVFSMGFSASLRQQNSWQSDWLADNEKAKITHYVVWPNIARERFEELQQFVQPLHYCLS